MQHIICPFEVKNDPGTTDGIITRYGNIFGNIDSYGDVVAPGAFKKTINDVMTGVTARPAMLLQHGGESAEDKTPIGIWTSMEEDSKGLRLQGKLAIKTKRGADAYALLKMTPRPALNGLSIGYRAKEFELHRTGPAKRTLKAIDLVEVSLVTFPANRLATVTGVKSGYEAAPEMTMRDLAWADFIELRRLSNTNRIGR
jgi:uncharacterized protein